MPATTAHLILDPKDDHIALFASLESLLQDVKVHDALIVQTDNPKIARLVAEILGPGTFTPPAGVLVHYHTGLEPLRDPDQPAILHRRRGSPGSPAMKPWIHSMPFIDRHKVDIDAATASFRKARLAREQGRLDEATRFTEIADGMLARLEELREEEKKGPAK